MYGSQCLFPVLLYRFIIMTLSVGVWVVPSHSKGGGSMDSSKVQSNVSVVVYLIGVFYFNAHILPYFTKFPK